MFTLLGITATFAGGVLADYLPALRVIGGIVLVVMGLSLAGHPAHPGPRAHLAAARRRRVGEPRDDDRRHDARPGRRAADDVGDRVGSRLVGGRAGLGAAFTLGAVFAIGWTPCIGIILGGILTLAATSEGKAPGRAAARRLHPRPRHPVHHHRGVL